MICEGSCLARQALLRWELRGQKEGGERGGARPPAFLRLSTEEAGSPELGQLQAGRKARGLLGRRGRLCAWEG